MDSKSIHFKEINQEFSKFGSYTFSFTPSLVPVNRGLQSTIYIDKRDN